MRAVEKLHAKIDMIIDLYAWGDEVQKMSARLSNLNPGPDPFPRGLRGREARVVVA